MVAQQGKVKMQLQAVMKYAGLIDSWFLIGTLKSFNINDKCPNSSEVLCNHKMRTNTTEEILLPVVGSGQCPSTS